MDNAASECYQAHQSNDASRETDFRTFSPGSDFAVALHIIQHVDDIMNATKNLIGGNHWFAEQMLAEGSIIKFPLRSHARHSAAISD
jgi:hypothetical protein